MVKLRQAVRERIGCPVNALLVQPELWGDFEVPLREHEVRVRRRQPMDARIKVVQVEPVWPAAWHYDYKVRRCLITRLRVSVTCLAIFCQSALFYFYTIIVTALGIYPIRAYLCCSDSVSTDRLHRTCTSFGLCFAHVGM